MCHWTGTQLWEQDTKPQTWPLVNAVARSLNNRTVLQWHVYSRKRNTAIIAHKIRLDFHILSCNPSEKKYLTVKESPPYVRFMLNFSDIWGFYWDQPHSKVFMLEKSTGKFSKPAAEDCYLADPPLSCWQGKGKDFRKPQEPVCFTVRVCINVNSLQFMMKNYILGFQNHVRFLALEPSEERSYAFGSLEKMEHPLMTVPWVQFTAMGSLSAIMMRMADAPWFWFSLSLCKFGSPFLQ